MPREAFNIHNKNFIYKNLSSNEIKYNVKLSKWITMYATLLSNVVKRPDQITKRVILRVIFKM